MTQSPVNWEVVNVKTGIVVSTWPSQDEAWAEKDRVDAVWRPVEGDNPSLNNVLQVRPRESQ